MAYERENECKHIAALAFSLRESAGPAATSRLPKNDDDNGPLPFVFEKCAHAPPVLAWLERSGVEARAVPYVSQYASLHDWWRSSRTNAGARNLRAAIRLAAPLVEKKLDALRDFVPPEMPRDGTAYAELYAALHRLHMRVRDRAVVLGAPPWPLEGGVLGDHPGFEVELDTRRWTLRLRERSPYRASGAVPRLFVCSLGGAAHTKPAIQGLPDDPDDPSDHDAARAYRAIACDASDVLALQALLAMMLERRGPAIVLLASKLATPVWEAALVEVEAAAPAPVGEREWCFVVGPSYGNGIAVSAFVRKRGKNGALLRATKAPLDGIFGEAAASDSEREIATLILAASSFSQHARFELGTPPAHAILRHLAAHPRVTIAPPASARSKDPASGPRATIVASDAVVSMVQESGIESDALVPRFFAGDVELDPRALVTAKGPFVGSIAADRIVHVFVPAAARGWAALAAEKTSTISFPKHAGPRVVAALKPLLASGHARVPADVMGDELPYEPSAGVRVEWGPGAKATIELLIRPHGGAPLVSAGAGSPVFTFVHDGRPAFVTRDFDRELMIVDELANAIDALADPLVWVGSAAATSSAEAAIALGRWLEESPFGLPIEVRLGRAPSVIAIDDVAGEVKIQKKGAWLVLDGALDVHGTKITLGEVLEAVRLARSFIEAKPGVFLELSREASNKLALLAAASELAGSSSSSDVRIHHGLHGAITEAQGALANVGGLDAMALVGRLERSGEGMARAGKHKRARSTPSLLEHGTLRAYQHDAVQWPPKRNGRSRSSRRSSGFGSSPATCASSIRPSTATRRRSRASWSSRPRSRVKAAACSSSASSRSSSRRFAMRYRPRGSASAISPARRPLRSAARSSTSSSPALSTCSASRFLPEERVSISRPRATSSTPTRGGPRPSKSRPPRARIAWGKRNPSRSIVWSRAARSRRPSFRCTRRSDSSQRRYCKGRAPPRRSRLPS